MSRGGTETEILTRSFVRVYLYKVLLFSSCLFCYLIKILRDKTRLGDVAKTPSKKVPSRLLLGGEFFTMIGRWFRTPLRRGSYIY